VHRRAPPRVRLPLSFFLRDACCFGRHNRGTGWVTTEATAPLRVNHGLCRFFVRLWSARSEPRGMRFCTAKGVTSGIERDACGSDLSRAGKSLYIGNLPYHGVTEGDLRSKFTDGIGTIKDLRMREGFAFIEYEVSELLAVRVS
jgi:hypothetical protein